MNQRLEELARQAGLESFYVEYSPWQVEFEKFAELIVQDCINQVDIKNELVSEVVFQTLELAKRRIRKHFEVE